MRIMQMKNLDVVIIIILILISFLPGGIFMLTKANHENRYIVIRVNGEVKKSIPINNEEKNKIYEFDFNGNVGYIEVNKGRVRMVEMSKEICPDKVCSNTGWINKGYQSIVCLPNQIIVTIEGIKDDELDGRTY